MKAGYKNARKLTLEQSTWALKKKANLRFMADATIKWPVKDIVSSDFKLTLMV